MSNEDLKKLDEQGMAAWDSHDIDSFVGLFADTFSWQDVTSPAPMTTEEQVRGYMQTWFTAFPDMRAKTVNRVIGDNKVAAEVEFTGTHTGPMAMGGKEIPATGKSVIGKGTYFVHVADGKIAEFHSYPDVAGVMAQLGLM